jgi:predicted nucleotidyltransferase
MTKNIFGFSQKQVQAEINNIVAQVIKKYRPDKIILFGSLAQGQMNESSDIDLFIIKKKPPKNGIKRLHEIENLIKYKIAVDFIICSPEETKKYLKLGDPFIHSIFKTGRVLYG